MNRRDFLKGLSSIVPAALLARLALPEVEATVEAVEHVEAIDGIVCWNGGIHDSPPPQMTEKEREFKNFGGYFA